ncbi:MAG: aspartate kinase [Lachnospirales bacterium]
MLVVQKYGGSSVATVERIFNVARRIMKTKSEGHDVVVILSAQGDTTDNLLDLAKSVNKNASKRELDMLLSTGEQQSIALMAMALQSLDVAATSLNAWQIEMETSNNHSNARIVQMGTERILNEIDRKNAVIIAGFQGVNKYYDITTLGRGGSDTTAVAVAAAINADLCEIYTDVDGVYTGDPRHIKNAQKLKEISYDEMLELASLGAQVLHNRSVEMAKKYNVNLCVRSSFSDLEGTVVKEEVNMEKMLVSGVAVDKNCARITVAGMENIPGNAYNIFSSLSNERISVDIILQSTDDKGKSNISFTVANEDLDNTLKVLESKAHILGYSTIESVTSLAKLSIVGAGMATNPGVASSFFEVLYEIGAKIDLISTSEIKISVLVPADVVDVAANEVHDRFFKNIRKFN